MTGSKEQFIYFFDFEVLKLVGFIELPEGVEPSALTFINGFGILVVAGNDARIYLVHFSYKELKINFQLINYIDLEPARRQVFEIELTNYLADCADMEDL